MELRPSGKVAGRTTYEVAGTTRGRQLLALLEPAIKFLEEGDAVSSPSARPKQ